MRPHYSITTQPVEEAVTLNELMAHCRVDSEDDADELMALAAVAREYVDSVTGRVSVVTAYKASAASWSALMWPLCSAVQLFRTPLVAVQAVSYYPAGSDTLTVLSPSTYRAITTSEPGMIQFMGVLPEVDNSRPDAIQIDFTAGYPEYQSPAMLRHAVKMIAGHLYENRLPVAFASCSSIPYSLTDILENQKIGGWFA